MKNRIVRNPVNHNFESALFFTMLEHTLLIRIWSEKMIFDFPALRNFILKPLLFFFEKNKRIETSKSLFQ